MKLKNKISAYLIFIASLTLVSIFIYMATVSYNNLIKPVQQAKDSPLTKPLPTGFDTTVLDQIEQKNEYQSAPTPESTVSATPTL